MPGPRVPGAVAGFRRPPPPAADAHQCVTAAPSAGRDADSRTLRWRPAALRNRDTLNHPPDVRAPDL